LLLFDLRREGHLVLVTVDVLNLKFLERNSMKKRILAAAVVATFGAGFACADDVKPADVPAPAAPIAVTDASTPDNVVTYNIAVASDYRYRGISQTRLDPALQGGADYTNNPTGFYLGTWLSSIKWISDAGGSDNVEWDMYGGKRGDLIKDKLSYDVGVLSYVYPSNDLHPSANTTELYGQLGFGPSFYAKYSFAVSNLFGFANSKNSGYLDLGANIDVGNGFTINLHGGHQTVENNSASSYTDWKAGVTKDFGVVSGALAVIGTNTNNYVAPNGTNLGKTSLVLLVTKTF